MFTLRPAKIHKVVQVCKGSVVFVVCVFCVICVSLQRYYDDVFIYVLIL